MSSSTPQESPQESWSVWEKRIGQLVKDAFLHLSDQEFYEMHSQEIVEKIKNKYLDSGISSSEHLFIPSVVEKEVKRCIDMKRQQTWDAHKELTIQIVREALPPAVREFETYYVNVLSRPLFKEFANWRPESRPSENFQEWWKKVVKENVDLAILRLTNDNGELQDEELVRLYRAGFPNCKTLLLERYSALLPQLAPRIVYAKGICPESEDSVEFAKDVAQEVAVK